MLKIEHLDHPQSVYDVTVAKNENFYANGILVHNCQEIALPTTPMGSTRRESVTIALQDLTDFLTLQGHMENTVRLISVDHSIQKATVEITEDTSRIALCTLSAINWGVIKDTSQFERIGRLTVRALDNLLDHQNYPVAAARKHTAEYRPLGVGIINFAYFLAKNNVKYTDGSALELVDEWAEAWSYYLIKASIELAKERGACRLSRNTKYQLGIMPIDTRKLEVDQLVPHRERLNWEALRRDGRTYGIRNATVTAIMPAETSAQISNSTNGIEPPRSYVSVKQSKHGVLKQVVPEIRRLKNKYELLWDQQSPEGYLQLCAVLQKYIDQAISVNTSYNPKFFEDEKIPMSVLLKDILNAYKFGTKQIYYNNTLDGQGEINIETLAAKPVTVAKAIHVVEAEACESCTI